jgi:hypothetical protein
MPTKTFNPTLGDLLKKEYDREFCRDVGTLLANSGSLLIGQMLGKRAVDPTPAGVIAAAAAGNTGNGVFTKDATNPSLAGAQPGVYRVVAVEPGTNLGTFVVFDPAGVMLGTYVVGAAAFSNQIKFTIADGATDFSAGDSFTVTVPAGDGKFVPLKQAAQADGSHVFAGILCQDADTTGADFANAMILVRGPAMVAKDRLIWDASFTTQPQKDALTPSMTAAGILNVTTA